MSDFWIYFQIGLKHVLNIYAYDHVLFLEHSKDINFRDESEFSMFFTIENLKALKSLIDYQLSLK